jgi:hypothetical protein
MVREPHNLKGGLQEIPFNSIIGLGHVSLDTHIPFPAVAVVKMMKNLISNQNIISNKSPWNKSTLVRADHIRKDQFNSVGNGLCNDLQGHITQRYGSKITRMGGVIFLRNKANVGVVVRFRAPPIV